MTGRCRWRISPALAGTVILISKVYDSITDPFEGILADRTRTQLGWRRPHLLAGYPRYDNLYTQAGCPAHNVDIRHDGHWLALDWHAIQRRASSCM